MKYRIGDIHVGRNDKILIPMDTFTYGGIASTQWGRIANSPDVISFFGRMWSDKWIINDIYLDGFANNTINPMKILLTYYAGATGEAFNTHNQVDVSFSLGSVITGIRYEHSLLSTLSGVTNDDKIFLTFEYDSTVGEETDYYVQGVIVEYYLR